MPLFDELLVKVAKGEKLSESELADFRLEAKLLNDVKTQVAGWFEGRKVPRIDELVIGRVTFLESPSKMGMFSRNTDTEIAHNTNTYVSFETTHAESKIFKIDEADATKILIQYTGNVFQVSGIDTWEANATGFRSLKVEFYDEAATLLVSQFVHISPPVNGDDTGIPFIFGIHAKAFVNVSYMKFVVAQNSGAGLDLKSIVVILNLV